MNSNGMPRQNGMNRAQKSVTVPAWPTARPESLQAKSVPNRRHAIEWLNFDGAVENQIVNAPVLPIFERTTNALARGALVQTPNGHVAIEDIRPGTHINTIDGDTHVVQWVSSVSILPASNIPVPNLFRIAEGSLGSVFGMPDLLVGPGARLMRQGHRIDKLSKLTNIDQMVDGFSVIQIVPRSPIQLYHLALASHQLISVNGVVMETFHPGSSPQLHMSEEMFRTYAGMFPHMARMADFGPLNYRRQD